MAKSYEMDMCNGPLVKKMLSFALPLMASGLLQLLFNAVDMIVVGRYVGSNALAAVGSTGALVNLLINLFMGFAVGANVLVARYFGGKKKKDVQETVHTAILLGIIAGVVLSVIGITTTRGLLVLMGSPKEVLEMSAIYLKIYFLGMPFLLVYDFGASILRAVGDTKRPLFFLIIAGSLNVILNLVFVVGFQLQVAGAALATVISQMLSAVLIVLWMRRLQGPCHLSIRKLKLHKEKLYAIVKIGLPAGLQGTIFSFSNVLIQSSINRFGAVAMAGNTAAGNIEGFIYIAMNAFYHTSLSFTGQNYGGGKYERIQKVLNRALIMVILVGLTLGISAYFAGGYLLTLYTTDPKVIYYGMLRMSIISTFYFLCGTMEVIVGCLRGMGYSIMPMFVSLMGACVFRIIWILTIFKWQQSLVSLYVSYPVSWALTILVHLLCYWWVRKKQIKEGKR